MAKKIKIVGQQEEHSQEIDPAVPRSEAEEMAAASGAEPDGPGSSSEPDPISLTGLGHALLRQLRSTGGRPALEGATERCKVPLAPEDVSALEQIIAIMELQTGSKPALGQIISVIVRTYLDLVRKTIVPPLDAAPTGSENPAKSTPPLRAFERLMEEHLKPIREELELLKKEVASKRSP